MSKLNAPYFQNEAAAFERLEGILWPDGAVCPKCGGKERITKVRGARTGLWRCGPCKRQFTATVGTLFERSHVKMHLWFQAVYLMAASKKGFSAHQLHRTLGVTYKTAWFMAHRIREAMRSGDLAPFGGEGQIVESDETFLGRDPTKKVRRGYGHKHVVLTLLDRSTGRARSMKIGAANAISIVPMVRRNIAAESVVFTDDATYYKFLDTGFADHKVVRHSRGEYVRGDVHTNTLEGFFSIFKRGMKGVYQHCDEKHIHRYLAEFDFRYNERAALGVDDERRTVKALAGIAGRRLLYRDSCVAS